MSIILLNWYIFEGFSVVHRVRTERRWLGVLDIKLRLNLLIWNWQHSISSMECLIEMLTSQDSHWAESYLVIRNPWPIQWAVHRWFTVQQFKLFNIQNWRYLKIRSNLNFLRGWQWIVSKKNPCILFKTIQKLNKKFSNCLFKKWALKKSLENGYINNMIYAYFVYVNMCTCGHVHT